MVRQNRKIQFIILLVLVCLVGTMSIAYAVLSTTLNINGTAQVMDASWDVHFDNVQVNPYSVPINPTITDKDKINFFADLTTPGQFYKFTVDIVNDGSIDAMIESIIKNPELTVDQKKYLRYEVEYIDGTSINETQLLKSGETKTISVLVSYRNDIPTSNLPQTETDLDLEIRLVYVQATSIGTDISNGEKVIKVVSGDLNTVGSEICIKEECFHLISNDGYTVTMLSKYNLYVGANVMDDKSSSIDIVNSLGIQDSSALGYMLGNTINVAVVPFSDNAYWRESVFDYPAEVYDHNSVIYSYIQNYKNYIESFDIFVDDARVISIDELLNLGCDVSDRECSGSPSWLFTTSFWTGIAWDKTDVLSVTSTGGFGTGSCSRYSRIGVRPVIVIPLSEF